MSTLQFVDNIILFHNFERCDTILIDLKSDSEDKILCKINNNKIKVKNFPMTSHEIYEANKDKLSDLIQAKINVDSNGDVITKFEYDYIETVSMLSFNNRNICMKN